MGTGNLRERISGVVSTVLLILGLVIYNAVRWLIEPSAARERLSSLGIDKKKADVDKMIAVAGAQAIRWKSDAGFWSVEIPKLRSDGTVDLSDANVLVEYFSPSAMSSPRKEVRDDSIRKFNFVGDDMIHGDTWGVSEPYSPAPRATAIPGCTVKQLAARLGTLGLLRPGSTVHVSIDPASGDAWRVRAGGVPRQFDLQTCSEKK
ncbi:MAG: hypothetical protein QM820_03800 [Minicystis sp.]